MIKDLTFKKIGKRWYVDLPEWDGATADLEMVMGADTLLEVVAQKQKEFTGSDREVCLTVWDYYSENTFLTDYGVLSLHDCDYLSDGENGAVYKPTLTHQSEIQQLLHSVEEIWLCNVVKYIFGIFPPTLYIAF